MAFADAFSAESVNKLMSDPRMLLGLQMMSQGRQGSGAQALGQAGSQAAQLMQQQQHQQGLAQYRQQMIAQQQQAATFQQQQAQAKAEQQQRQAQALQDPNLQSQLGPLAKTLAGLGMPLDDVLKAASGDNLQAHRAAQLAQNQSQFDMRQAHVGGGGGGDRGPKAPTPRQLIIEPLENNMLQKHLYDAASGSYKPYGRAYPAFAPGKSGAVEETVDQLTPDVGAGLGQLPGNAPLSSYTKQPMQGAELLQHSNGANPMARPPSNSTADGVLASVTIPDGQGVADGILNNITPKYATPPKASQPQYPGAPAVGTVRKGFKFLGGNPADPKSWSKV